MAASFASHAAVALELAQARADQITLAQVEDHDRIAADLHDHVIQELFALGMRLQGHAARSDPAHRGTDQRLRRRPRRDHLQDPHQHLRAPPAPAVPGRPARPAPGDHRRACAAARLHRRHPLRRAAGPGRGRGPGPRRPRRHPRGPIELRAARPRQCRQHLPGPGGRADHPRHHRQRPRSRHTRPLQRPDQHAPPRRTQRRHPPAHHLQHWRYSPDLDRRASHPSPFWERT